MSFTPWHQEKDNSAKDGAKVINSVPGKLIQNIIIPEFFFTFITPSRREDYKDLLLGNSIKKI